MFYSSDPRQRKQTGSQSHVLQFSRPLQRKQTGPQSHVLQFCPLFRETRQDHSLMFHSSAPSPEKPDRTAVPCSTALPLVREARQDHSYMFYSSAPRQRSQTGPQLHVLQLCPSSEKPDGSSGSMEQHCKNSCWATWRTFCRPQPSSTPPVWPFEAEPCSDAEEDLVKLPSVSWVCHGWNLRLDLGRRSQSLLWYPCKAGSRTGDPSTRISDPSAWRFLSLVMSVGNN